MRAIAAHMGGYLQWDEVERHLIGRDLFLDTSYSFGYLGEERMTALIRAHGAGRILFGSDSPWTEQAAALSALQSLHLAEEELNAISSLNAERLLAKFLNLL